MLHTRLSHLGAHLVFLAVAACGTSSSPGADAGPPGPRIDAAPPPPALDGGLGAPVFGDGELDAPSHGGTITFEPIGKAGSYPSRRDPDVGPCDARDEGTCCMAKRTIEGDQLTPWDDDLILTLRGPLLLKQLAVYQPSDAASPAAGWSLVSAWDSREASAPRGMAFRGNAAEDGFAGVVGTECLVDVSTDAEFACGTGSLPFCPGGGAAHYQGWAGSKLFVLLARMPHADEAPTGSACSDNTDGLWYDAPWLGLSLGELVRAGAFSDCQCYAQDPAKWYLGDGCGQFNVFEVVNDRNDFTNLDIFSTNFFGYAGYVGEGPCGGACNVAGLPAAADLVDKAHDTEAAAGALASPTKGPGAAFRRPAEGYRYFVILLDVPTRTVQLAVVHPGALPASLASLLPALPPTIATSTVDAVRGLRLPQ
jgi:hypothetical protein